MEGAPTRREGPSRIAQQRAQRSCGSQYVTGRRSERSSDLAFILTDPSFLYPRLTSCYIPEDRRAEPEYCHKSPNFNRLECSIEDLQPS